MECSDGAQYGARYTGLKLREVWASDADLSGVKSKSKG